MNNPDDIILILGLLFLIFTTFRIFSALVAFIRSFLGLPPAYKKIDEKYKPYLQKHLPFYNQLNTANKQLFEKRVQLFIDLKTFVPRGGLTEITPELKAIIAGSAIQITFGYTNIYFKHFRKILVFPDKYFNKTTGQYHKGEVNSRGAIVLSINNLIKGFADASDGINLGLHEMAHALNLENMIKNDEFRFINTQVLFKFRDEFKNEAQKINAGQNILYRKYGAANFQEFFAVSVELFFEKPFELKNYSPYLFSLIEKILNLEPIGIHK